METVNSGNNRQALVVDMRTLAQSYAGHAKEFFDAAERLSLSTPYLFHPTFYCAIHSIELAIKAHLANIGVTKKELTSRDLGHNLTSLLREAGKRGIMKMLNLNSREIKSISFGSTDYAGKCFEYPEGMYSTLPVGIWLKIADKIISGIPQSKKPDTE